MTRVSAPIDEENYLRQITRENVLSYLSEIDLQWLLDSFGTIEMFATKKFVGAAIRETRVQPYVLFVIRKTPKGYSQLELFRYRRIEVLHQFKGNMRCDASR